MERAPTAGTASSPPASDPIFGRVLVGVDDTPESVVAAAQARALAPAGAHLAIVAVAETAFAAWAGSAATFATGGVEHETEDLLEQASELADPDERRLTTGRLVDVLCAECERAERDAHRRRRAPAPPSLRRRLRRARGRSPAQGVVHPARRAARLGPVEAEPGGRRHRRLRRVAGGRAGCPVARDPTRLRDRAGRRARGTSRARGSAGRARGRRARTGRARRGRCARSGRVVARRRGQGPRRRANRLCDPLQRPRRPDGGRRCVTCWLSGRFTRPPRGLRGTPSRSSASPPRSRRRSQTASRPTRQLAASPRTGRTRSSRRAGRRPGSCCSPSSATSSS